MGPEILSVAAAVVKLMFFVCVLLVLVWVVVAMMGRRFPTRDELGTYTRNWLMEWRNRRK